MIYYYRKNMNTYKYIYIFTLYENSYKENKMKKQYDIKITKNMTTY